MSHLPSVSLLDLAPLPELHPVSALLLVPLPPLLLLLSDWSISHLKTSHWLRMLTWHLACASPTQDSFSAIPSH